MFRRILFLTALFILSVTFSYGQEVNSQTAIQQIKFEGLINGHAEDLKPLIDLKEGGKYNEASLNTSLKKLYSLDMFKDVKADITNGTNGLIITFLVEENYYLKTVDFQGNDEISSDELKKVISFTDYSYYSESKAAKSIAAIEKKYVEDGFREVTVSQKLNVVDVKKQTFNLVFKVTPGRRIVVEKIDVSGNENVKADEIRSVMKTKTVFFIFVTGALKEDEFEKDKEEVTKLYQQKGYIDVTFKDFSWKVTNLGDDKHKAIVVNIDVAEGPQYRTGKISITGNTLFTTAELQKFIDLKQGDIYDKVKMDNTRLKIFNKYSDDGHLYANVSLLMNRTATNRMIDSELVIVEGPRTHIEHISVSGNTKTETKVITRELDFHEGEQYVQWKVRTAYERLMNLQYFNDVKPVFLPGSAEGLIDLDLNVEEARTGIITFGVGYGTVSLFNLSGQIAEKNLFGTGRDITLKATVGQTAQGASISYQEPWLFDLPYFAGITFSYMRQEIIDVPADTAGNGFIDGTNINYIENPSNSIGIYVSSNSYWVDQWALGGSLGRRLPDYWQVDAGIGTIFYRDYGANFNNPLIFTDHWDTNFQLENALTSGFLFKNYLSLGFTRNSTDHPLRPLYGSIFNANINYYGGVMGGYAQFLRPAISYSWYWNPVWRIVLALYGDAEFMIPQYGWSYKSGQSDYVYDFSDMLWFDGVYQLRGWNNLSIRGLSKAYYSGEIRFEIYDPVWGVLFYDLGNLYQTYNGFAPFSPDGYLFSFGIGIQVNIMGLPIRIYIARKGEWDPDRRSFVLDQDQNLFDNLTPVLSIQGVF